MEQDLVACHSEAAVLSIGLDNNIELKMWEKFPHSPIY